MVLITYWYWLVKWDLTCVQWKNCDYSESIKIEVSWLLSTKTKPLFSLLKTRMAFQSHKHVLSIEASHIHIMACIITVYVVCCWCKLCCACNVRLYLACTRFCLFTWSPAVWLMAAQGGQERRGQLQEVLHGLWHHHTSILLRWQCQTPDTVIYICETLIFQSWT